MPHNSAGRITSISELEIGDRAEIVVDRFSNSSNHFIAYLSDSDYDSNRDGIHVELPDTKADSIKQLLSHDSVVIKSNVKIVNTDGYVLGKLEEGFDIKFNLGKGKYSKIQEVIQSISSSEGISVDGSDIRIPIYFTKNEDNEYSENNQNTTTNRGKKTQTLRQIELNKPDASDAEVNGTLLYYVNSHTADCYHSNKKCEGLRRKEGDIIQVVQQGDNLPDEISDRRGCHRCT